MLFFFYKIFKNIFCNCCETVAKLLRNCYETAKDVVIDLLTFLSSALSSNLLKINKLTDKLTWYFLTFFCVVCQKVIYLYQIKNN